LGTGGSRNSKSPISWGFCFWKVLLESFLDSGPSAHFSFLNQGECLGMAKRAEELRKLVEPVINALGCQLWGIEFLGQGRHTLLRIYLDKPGGVDIEDCAEASRQISGILDVEDPISSEYTLEVSSPGLDRILFTPDQFRGFTGSTVKIRLSENFEGRRNFQGRLDEVLEDEIAVVAGEDRFVFPLELIEKANVVAN
jgi:ribosome maturation factor RimP